MNVCSFLNHKNRSERGQGKSFYCIQNLQPNMADSNAMCDVTASGPLLVMNVANSNPVDKDFFN